MRGDSLVVCAGDHERGIVEARHRLVAERPHMREDLRGSATRCAPLRAGPAPRTGWTAISRWFWAIEPPVGATQLEMDAAQARLAIAGTRSSIVPEFEHRRRLERRQAQALARRRRAGSSSCAPTTGARAVSDRNLEGRAVAAPIRQTVPLRHDHRVGIHDREQLVEDARDCASCRGDRSTPNGSRAAR